MRLSTPAIMILLFALGFTAISRNEARAAEEETTASIRVSAIVRSIDDPLDLLGGAFAIGDAIDGRFTYDFETQDVDPSPQSGDYWHPSYPAGIRLEGGGHVFAASAAAGFRVEIDNDVLDDGSVVDAYRLTSFNNEDVAGLLIDRIEWHLVDPSATALDDDALPADAPDLARFGSTHGLVIHGCVPDSNGWCDYLRTFTIEADVVEAAYDTAPMDCRTGNVNAQHDVLDVLFVNGSAGDGETRSVTIDRNGAIEIAMDAPPGEAHAPFALYLFKGMPAGTTVRDLPYGLGMSCMPLPLTDAAPLLLAKLANNIGHPQALGTPDLESTAAPSLVAHDPRLPGRPLDLFVQGLIVDEHAPNGRVAITNGIVIHVR